MANLNKRSDGALVFECTDANVAGGLMCIPSTTATTITGVLGGYKVAGDAAVNAIGVSLSDAVTAANFASLSSFVSSDPGLYANTNVSVPGITSTVDDAGFYVLQATAVAIAAGIKICCAASGAVRAWVSGTDPVSSIIGRTAAAVSSAGGPVLCKLDT